MSPHSRTTSSRRLQDFPVCSALAPDSERPAILSGTDLYPCFLCCLPAVPLGSVSLDSQSSADSLRIRFPCHLKGTQDVTGFGFVSPVLHDGEPEPPSTGRGWRRQAPEDRGIRSLLRIFGVPQGFAQLLTFGRQKESALMSRLGALLRPNLAILCRIATVRKEPTLRSYLPAEHCHPER